MALPERIPLNKRVCWLLLIYLLIYENADGTISYALAVLFIAYSILPSARLPKLKIVYPILAILPVGLIVGIIYTGITTDFIRDIYYFTQPVIYTYFSFLLYRRYDYRYDLKLTIIYAAAIIAVIYVINLIQNPSLLFASDSVTDIRNEVGKESFLSFFSLVLILTQKVELLRNRKYILTALLTAVLVLQFSRAIIGTVAVFYLVFYLLQEQKLSVKIFKNIGVCLCVLMLIIALVPSSLMSDFVERILRSSDEISSTGVTVWTKNVAYTNWRGYEIYLVTEAFKDGSYIQKLLGYGFGNRVALGQGITLDGLTSIPVFHNGYIQIINKTGVYGCLCFAVFMFKIMQLGWKYRHVRHQNFGIRAKFLIALCCAVLFYSYFKGGIFRGTSILELFLWLGFYLGEIHEGGNDDKRAEPDNNG